MLPTADRYAITRRAELALVENMVDLGIELMRRIPLGKCGAGEIFCGASGSEERSAPGAQRVNAMLTGERRP